MWRFRGVNFSELVGGDQAWYERVLDDGTRLIAYVGDDGGRPICNQIIAIFPTGARNFGRELAITELEQVINNNDRIMVQSTHTGERISPFALTDIPVAPVRGSRGRKIRWTDRRLAELVRDLQRGDAAKWHLERNSIRQRANEAVRRGIAEVA